jgi:5-methylcytosine-specific restriction endonuclease McrA
MSHTLILNADYQPISLIPLSVIDWQQAIKLQWLGKLHVLHTYEDWIVHSPTTSFHVPAVCVTSKYYKVPLDANFSRSNLYIRDAFVCQYCNEQYSTSELSIDHVIPQSLGGGTSWENCVTSCKPCNHGKGSKLIKPIRQPYAPSYWDLARKSVGRHVKIKHDSWRQYLKPVLS